VGSNDPTTHATTSDSVVPPNPPQRYFAEDATLGDEFISLTFHESDDESEGEEDEEGQDDDEDMDDDDEHDVTEHNEEGSDDDLRSDVENA
jgi:hypothetical protein